MLALSSLKGDGERNVRFLRALPFAPAYLWQLGAYIRLLLADDDVGVAGFTSRPSFVSPLPLGQQRGKDTTWNAWSSIAWRSRDSMEFHGIDRLPITNWTPGLVKVAVLMEF